MPTTDHKIAALQRAAETSPEYADIVPLFIGIYEYVLGKEDSTGIAFALSSDNPATVAQEKMSLIHPGSVTIDRQQTVTFLLGILDTLAAKGHENGNFLELIAAALHKDSVDPKPVYCAIMERNRTPITELAATLAVPAALVEYLFEIPLKTALEQFAANYSADSFSGWQESFCPVCGSRAGMAQLAGEEGRRMLSCSACAFQWPFKRLTCAYCGCDEPEKLSYFTAGDGSTRVDTCKACSRYIKTRDSRKGTGDTPLEIEDLLTIHLDMLAAREGFERGH